MGGGVPCGAIEWERTRGDRENVKHGKHMGLGLQGLAEGVSQRGRG